MTGPPQIMSMAQDQPFGDEHLPYYAKVTGETIPDPKPAPQKRSALATDPRVIVGV